MHNNEVECIFDAATEYSYCVRLSIMSKCFESTLRAAKVPISDYLVL